MDIQQEGDEVRMNGRLYSKEEWAAIQKWEPPVDHWTDEDGDTLTVGQTEGTAIFFTVSSGEDNNRERVHLTWVQVHELIESLRRLMR